MSPLDVADNNAATETQRALSAYVPPLQRTEGQPPPIAAHGGLSYMAFDQEGDAGTAAALQDALAEIAEGEGQRVIDMVAKAPPGPIKTKWGLGFRDYDEVCELHPPVEQHQSPGRRRGAGAALYGLRAADHSVVPSNAVCGGTRRAPTSRRSC